MTDSDAGPPDDTGGEAGNGGAEDENGTERPPEELREEVEEKYDFEDFGPRDMAEMSPEEWDAAFDPDTWITGEELLDRVERDLKTRIANRDVFATIDREHEQGEEVLVAYSDEGYAVVYPDGSIEGSGTVLRDVKPSVALCSMEDYEVPEPPADAGLPSPEEIEAGSSELGNTLLQAVGFAQLVAGVLLLLAPFTYDPVVQGCPPLPNSPAHVCTVAGVDLVLYPLGSSAIIAAMAGIGFVLFGLLMLVVVANARLSDRFRSEQFKERLRAAGVDSEDRPEFVPDGERKD